MTEPHPSLLVYASGSENAIRRACFRGDLIRLTPGRYLRTAHWDSMSARQRHVQRAFAALSLLQGDTAVLSHLSAAAFWGLPTVGPWPTRVRVIDDRLDGATATKFTLKSPGALPGDDVVEFAGLLVTSPCRTAVDVALTTPMRRAVVALDHGLRVGLFTKDDLLKSLDERRSVRARPRATKAIEFADGRADRPGESLSRVIMFEARFPAPELQTRFFGPRGQTADTDFFFVETGTVGEFDGDVKYTNARMRSGRTPSQVVIAEKNRENWIRADARVRGFVRWVWSDLMEPGRLAGMLMDAGVRPLKVSFRPKSAE